MFSAKTYTARRPELRTKIGSGIILPPGNSLSPNNYPNNAYYFRQDSTFRYYFGLNVPSVVGVIDANTGEEALYGDDFTVEDIIWTGPQPTLREMGAGAGVTATFPMAELEKRLRRAISLGRRVHYLPPYRGETKLQLSALLGIKPALLHDYKSVDLMFAVAEMREKKSAEEVEEMERAFRIGYEMHTTAMRMCRPGVVERQIAGAIEGVAKSQGQGVSFPSIVSQPGETLHNLHSAGVLADGRLTDNKGRTVDFRNTIIIMTSNMGSQVIQDNFAEAFDGRKLPEEVVERTRLAVIDLLKQQLKPEFLNRIDEIVMFEPLTHKDIERIVDIQLGIVRRMLSENGIRLEYSDKAREWIASAGYEPLYGARPVKRVIQRYVVNDLSKRILAGEVDRSKPIAIDAGQDGLTFSN